MSKRYPKHHIERMPDMIVRGENLGPALKPQDIFIWLRRIVDIDDAGVIDAMSAADERLYETFPELTEDEVTAILAAEPVTRSRIAAWRKRHREMTWLELRALLVGLM